MDLKYPIGPFEHVFTLDAGEREACRSTLADLPRHMRSAVAGLTDEQLDTPYRPEGWTVRQVVHHVPDSHLNAYIRMKWGLTEDVPTIKPYDQDRWAELADGKTGSVDVSLSLLEAVHGRWDRLIRSLSDRDFSRKLLHPEWGEITIDFLLAQYAWHSKHHVAHITSLRAREGF